MENNIYIFDLEADNLYPYQENIWTIHFKKYNEDKWLRLNPFNTDKDVKQEILNFIFEKDNPMIVAHNGLGYDQWVLWKELGLNFGVGVDHICGRKVTFFDTLFASQYLLPDRPGGHSLKSWGKRFKNEKIEYRQQLIEKGLLDKSSKKGEEFKFYHFLMEEYCEQDVLVTEQTFTELYRELSIHKSINGFKLGQKNFYLMAAQSFTGVNFDKEAALKLIPRIENMMEIEKNAVDPLLPERPLKKTEEVYYKTPSKFFKKDGSLTSHYISFIEKHNIKDYGDNYFVAYGKKYNTEPNILLDVQKKMTIEDQKELKQYFLDSGWEPTMWNFKKDSNGKAIRDEKRQLILTSPKIQENGKICPNLEELDGEIPKRIVKFLSLRNRLGVLNTWVTHPRLDWDGRLPAGSSGIASTHRQKHTCVVNVPKAQDDVLLGKEFRSLFTADEGHVMIGVDQAALEARCQGHWTFRYDNGQTAYELLNGDPHSKNAKAFYPEETKNFDIYAEDFDKDHPDFKPYRSKSKNGGYAIMYGCAPPKLASTLGLPEKFGKKLLDNFWDANKALKQLKDNIEKFWINKGDKKWIPGIDGRRLYSRSKHSLVNLLFQSTGAIVVDYSLALLDMKLGGLKIDELGRPYYEYKGKIVKRLIYSHDESQLSSSQEISEEVANIFEWCMSESGKRLKFKIPLEGKADIGRNWSETH